MEPECHTELHAGPAVFHAIETVEFYSSQDSEGFSWRRHGDWESPHETIDSRDRLLAYAEDVEERQPMWLNGLGDRGRLEEDAGFPWFSTVFGRVIYSLRHIRHTLGEVNVLLTAAGLRPAEWR